MESSSRPALSRNVERAMQPSISRVTIVNVDDFERCLALSVDIAPAFKDQARRWLDLASDKFLEPGVRKRLIELLDRRARARAFVDRWGAGFNTAAT